MSSTQPAEISPFGTFTLLAVACLTIMVGCVIVPGLPTIAPALGVGGAASWLVTLPSLGVVLFGAAAGRLIDRIGAYRALCSGLVLYAVLGLAAILLRGPAAVFADRLLLGGATAVVMSSGTVLISEFYDGDDRLRMIARQGMAIELGGVIFLSIGGYLTGFGWAAPFGLYAFALVFLAMVVAFVPGMRPSRHEHVPVADQDGAGSMRSILLAAICSMLAFFSAVLILPFALSGTAGLSEAQTGYFLSFVSLVAVCLASRMPSVSKRIGDWRTLTVALTCYGCAHLVFAFAWSLPLFLIGGVLLGSGFGLSIPLVNHMTIERSPVRMRGRNLAYLSMAIFLGQFLASPLGYMPGGNIGHFIATAGIAFLAAIFALTRHSCPPETGDGDHDRDGAKHAGQREPFRR